MAQNYETSLLLDERASALEVLRRQKAFAEHCLKQAPDGVFFCRPAPGMNSLAILVRHMADNMLSRWGDFDAMLRGEADGEKPWRDREAEFADPEPTAETRRELMERWERGWAAVFAAIEPLTPADFDRRVTIRGAPHSVHLAVLRQVDHYAYHVGQIAIIGRMLVGAEGWDYFTVAPGRSAEFTRRVREANAERADGGGADRR